MTHSWRWGLVKKFMQESWLEMVTFVVGEKEKERKRKQKARGRVGRRTEDKLVQGEQEKESEKARYSVTR